MLSQEQALDLLKEYNPSLSLVNHGKSVGGVMRFFAKEAGEDPDYWEQVGLLHDIDYEKFPDQHCQKAVEILGENGYDEAFIRAVICHGYGMVTDVAPELYMEKVLYTTDELTGLITACAYLRPSKSVNDLEVKSVLKKFKAPSFAAGVNREVITRGAELLGLSLNEVIEKTILGMREVAADIGLDGSAA